MGQLHALICKAGVQRDPNCRPGQPGELQRHLAVLAPVTHEAEPVFELGGRPGHRKMLSSIPGRYLLGAGGTPERQCDTPECLQTRPDVQGRHRGLECKITSLENHCPQERKSHCFPASRPKKGPGESDSSCVTGPPGTSPDASIK